jgi:hypothetical protein
MNDNDNQLTLWTTRAFGKAVALVVDTYHDDMIGITRQI